VKLGHAVLVFVLLFFLAACSKEVNPREHLSEVYSAALDSIMEKDEALSSGMQFIAIDMSSLTGLNEQSKKEILGYFKQKYSIEAMEASYEKLIEQGLRDPETLVLKGVLLRIEKIDFVSGDLLFEGSKHRSGDGAVGVKGIVHFKNDQWVTKESMKTWIS